MLGEVAYTNYVFSITCGSLQWPDGWEGLPYQPVLICAPNVQKETLRSDMPTLTSESKISLAPHAVSCELAGETVILDMASDRYFALSAIGTQIWNLLQSPCTLGALCDRLVEEYDVTPEQCRADIEALLDQMANQGLVIIGECDPA